MKTASQTAYYSSDSLDRLGVVHAFMTRIGGVSPPPYSGLNFDTRAGDTQENVAANTALTARAFGFDAGLLVTFKQVHGAEVAVVDDGAPARGGRRVEADGAVSGIKGVVLGMLTADCLPVLLFDPASGAVGAAHAGWRGVVKGVVPNTVRAMAKKYGSKPGDLIAALGPAIGQCCYSIKEDVAAEFERAFPGKAAGYLARRDALYLDLGAPVREQLQSIGVNGSSIADAIECTSCGAGDRFFSYRKEGPNTGRQLSFIAVNR